MQNFHFTRKNVFFAKFPVIAERGVEDASNSTKKTEPSVNFLVLFISLWKKCRVLLRENNNCWNYSSGRCHSTIWAPAPLKGPMYCKWTGITGIFSASRKVAPWTFSILNLAPIRRPRNSDFSKGVARENLLRKRTARSRALWDFCGRMMIEMHAIHTCMRRAEPFLLANPPPHPSPQFF